MGAKSRSVEKSSLGQALMDSTERQLSDQELGHLVVMRIGIYIIPPCLIFLLGCAMYIIVKHII